MSKQKTTDEIKKHKTEALDNFSTFMDSLIESSDNTDNKRADLISYWIKDFQQYIVQEKSFDPTKIKSYKRGDVVKVNLGFNIGSEQGGLRYAIVLDRDNHHNSKTITIVPLTSQKSQKEVNPRDVFLGKELYNRLKSKYDSTKTDLETRRAKCEGHIRRMKSTRETFLKLSTTASVDLSKTINEIDEILREETANLEALKQTEDSLKKINQELQRMKNGSIAKIEQITTISKQRIYDPKKSADVLAGIHFSDAAMEKINEKIKELFIF